jgi:hypothetical protein
MPLKNEIYIPGPWPSQTPLLFLLGINDGFITILNGSKHIRFSIIQAAINCIIISWRIRITRLGVVGGKSKIFRFPVWLSNLRDWVSSDTFPPPSSPPLPPSP